MRSRLIVAVTAPLLLVAACGLPLDERSTRYDADDLPDEISNTTTTTTTTTTTVPSTVPSTEQPADSAPIEETTTTTQAPTLTAPVDLFYTVGFSDDLARLQRDLQIDAPLTQVLRQLEQPLPDVSEIFGFRTAVERDMVDGIVVDRGVATITLDQDEVDGLTTAALRRAIAQLVLTVTSFRLANGSGIGKVRFEIAGEGFPVYVPEFGGTSEPGEELSFQDFASMIATTPTPTPTTTPTTTTTTIDTTTTVATTDTTDSRPGTSVPEPDDTTG